MACPPPTRPIRSLAVAWRAPLRHAPSIPVLPAGSSGFLGVVNVVRNAHRYVQMRAAGGSDEDYPDGTAEAVAQPPPLEAITYPDEGAGANSSSHGRSARATGGPDVARTASAVNSPQRRRLTSDGELLLGVTAADASGAAAAGVAATGAAATGAAATGAAMAGAAATGAAALAHGARSASGARRRGSAAPAGDGLIRVHVFGMNWRPHATRQHPAEIERRAILRMVDAVRWGERSPPPPAHPPLREISAC